MLRFPINDIDGTKKIGDHDAPLWSDIGRFDLVELPIQKCRSISPRRPACRLFKGRTKIRGVIEPAVLSDENDRIVTPLEHLLCFGNSIMDQVLDWGFPG